DSTYLFEILDSNQLSCPTQKVSITIDRSKISNVTAAIKGNGACEGTAQTFEATAGYTNYLFKDKQGNVLQNSAANTYATSNKGIISNGLDVIVSNSLGCSNTISASAGTVFNMPVASFTYNYVSTLTYSFNTSSAANIKSTWDFGDGTIDSSNQKTINHTYASIGTYSVKLKESNQNCSDDSIMQLKAGGLGLKNLMSTHTISVYPNPITNSLTIDMSSLDEMPVSIEVIELNGKVNIFFNASQLSKNNIVNVNTENLSSGLYIIKITTSNDGVYYQKILKN
ncbi:MAG: T9SS type A sorting domain-containing protein, partial [Bacteroidetes bacterium]|nr:T9SS type A sorting domain-containing protein [Bacteroidota bacterium]